VRTERYVYVEYESGERELYNLANDAYELDNIYASADPDLVAPLGALRGSAALASTAGSMPQGSSRQPATMTRDPVQEGYSPAKFGRPARPTHPWRHLFSMSASTNC
jgi:hypothetical protein